MTDSNIPHKFWWLFLPLLFVVSQSLMEYFLGHAKVDPMVSENGPHEFLQAVLTAIGFVLCLLMLFRFPVFKEKLLAGWIGLAALSCFYVTGEEVSWGQHIFDWATPEFWSQVNDQNETNLHNTSSWLDQKPRLILEVGVMAGGLIFPLIKKYKPSVLPKKFEALYPPTYLYVIALIVIYLKAADFVADATDTTIYARVSEVIELYLYYFIVLYLFALKWRVNKIKTAVRAVA